MKNVRAINYVLRKQIFSLSWIFCGYFWYFFLKRKIVSKKKAFPIYLKDFRSLWLFFVAVEVGERQTASNRVSVKAADCFCLLDRVNANEFLQLVLFFKFINNSNSKKSLYLPHHGKLPTVDNIKIYRQREMQQNF